MSEKIVLESKVIAGEIQEATKTLELALEGNSDVEVVEAKNTFANVMRDYKGFMESLSDEEREKVHAVLKGHVEKMVSLAKQLPE